MNISFAIVSLVAVPFLGFWLSVLSPSKRETLISRIAMFTTGSQLLLLCAFIVYWLVQDTGDINLEELVLYRSKGYYFFINFYFDKIAACYLLVGSFITFLIARYSHYYMHLEPGYKRFFNTILLFFFGYNLTVLAGNFETFFIGWEVLGISSFLLIAFYRDRYLPVKNAVKVFSIYRIGDLGLLAAMWASHHFWHESITFFKMSSHVLVHKNLSVDSGIGIFIGLSLLVAALAKSAQVPFSSWLPRAMEGPTPSSAIFYGSLSVHLGVFLLLRTYPFWEGQIAVRVAIGLMGLLTAIVSSLIARVQSSIKPKIAYASITQIGIMFIEVALGWHTLALLHFAGNAFLRTYQLLVSPSVVSYLIQEQIYHFVPGSGTQTGKIRDTLYLLSLKEWNMDYFMTNRVFRFLKRRGKLLSFLTPKNVLYYFFPIYVTGFGLYFFQDILSPLILEFLPPVFALLGLVMVLRSFAENEHPRLAWFLILFNHISLALAVSFNKQIDFHETVIFFSGVVPAGIIGLICLNKLKKAEPESFDLEGYSGHIVKHQTLAFVFLLAALGLIGFPITPTFIGEDLLISHIYEHQFVLGMLVALSFVVSGISLIRIYARLFLGPQISPSISNPLKSS
ncbi:MAG: hypothetical protein LC115_05795 [Bacteroidia bacterium]|nr:hypothetical protein [Bacteroidia bacterium]